VSAFFLDSSALVKRYVREPGSAWLQSITDLDAGNRIVIVRTTWVEVLSALSRRQREGNLSPKYVSSTIKAFRHDIQTQYLTVEVDPALADLAGDLVMRYSLRAYDAVQLAAALELHAGLQPIALPTFLSADARLLQAAGTEGMITDNPNNYL
jgi:hypothetical protein